MPEINITFLNLLKEDYKKYPCFIETGTSYGTTIFGVEPFFEKLHTIEISEKYYNYTKNRYRGNKINFILGDSIDIFSKLLPTINDKTIFFLDGHYSSGDTGRGVKDVPLIEEIIQINNLYKNEGIIIIDDVRLFGTNITEDWSSINKETILEILKDRIEDVYYIDSELSKDDRLIIKIK
jgi:hypothetical protein